MGVCANGKNAQSCQKSNSGDQAETTILNMQILKCDRSIPAIMLKVCNKTCQVSKETVVCQIQPVKEMSECKPKNWKSEHDEVTSTCSTWKSGPKIAIDPHQSTVNELTDANDTTDKHSDTQKWEIEQCEETSHCSVEGPNTQQFIDVKDHKDDASATDWNSKGSDPMSVRRRNLTHGDEAPGPASTNGGTKTYCRDRLNVKETCLCPFHCTAKVCRVGKSQGKQHLTISCTTGYDDTGTAMNTMLTTNKENNTSPCLTSTDLYDGPPLGTSMAIADDNVKSELSTKKTKMAKGAKQAN